MSENSNLPKNRIAELRKTKKLSQAQLAKNTGLTRQAISLYEIGKREPKLETWIKLAKFFEVPIPYLQGISEYTNSDKKAADMLVHNITNSANDHFDFDKMRKALDVRADLSLDKAIKQDFNTAIQCIELLFSYDEQKANKYKNIISSSKLSKHSANLAEPVSTYVYFLEVVSDIFFNSCNGDECAKDCIKDIQNVFNQYDEYVTKEEHNKLIMKETKNDQKD